LLYLSTKRINTKRRLTSTIDQARMEFMTWWEKENKLGEGDYLRVVEKVKEATKGLQTQEMTLHNQWFRFGFGLYYGEKQGKEKFIPIAYEDGVILEWQVKHDNEPWWPVKDPETGTYCLLKVTLNEIPPPSGSMPTDQYINKLLDRVKWHDKEAMKILEALKPYASLIKNNLGDNGFLYKKVKHVVPEFPEV